MERPSCSDPDPSDITRWFPWVRDARTYRGPQPAAYVLLDKTTLVPATHDEWMADTLWFDRHVAHSRRGACEVSTIFLGMPSHVFETMVFWEGHALDQRQWVWATWHDAVEGHVALVAGIEAIQQDRFAAWVLEEDHEEPTR
jgi:hypothetical protein